MNNDQAPRRTPSGRAGTYVPQPGGYRAFLPQPLPPFPSLSMDRNMTRLLSRADRALAALDSAILTLPDPDLFLFMYIRKEAVLSSQIEGTQSSLNDLLRAEVDVISTDAPDDVGEVANYVNAMNYGLERLKTLPVSARLIREIHEKLMAGVRGGEKNPGEFRHEQVWIGPKNTPIQFATFVPPPPQSVEDSIAQLERYIHLDDDETDPPLVRVALAHAQFETIHPFSDGNGRVGRLLITFLLCEQGILNKPVLYLSIYFKENRQEYYERLQAIRDEGDWENWVSFFLLGVESVASQARKVARDINLLREEHWRLIAEKFGAQGGKALRILEHLYRRPFVSVNNVKDILGVSFENANTLVQKMEEYGILHEFTGQKRNRVYSYSRYIGLFSDL